ncbi:MAG: [NiFe]-hydrogenase assembly chaperone HybE [Azonexus sp.]|jgi:[NiFe] hydrogenase assembly HybE family chaperone|nr:[NiFe]-hydrogenase assembly chaperone HybE [Azonexus sp.]
MSQAESLSPVAFGQRLAALVAHFERVQVERMSGVPLLNAALFVEAIGFIWQEEKDGLIAEGILITPWFMSLWRLPAQHLPLGDRVGQSVARHFGSESFDFMTAFDPAIGYHESCALFSPMHDFASQEDARNTALAALAQLRPVVVASPAASSTASPPVPSRRAFLLRGLA